MTPEQLAKPNTEHAHQRAFFCWCNKASNAAMEYQYVDWRLKFAFAVPNGGDRNKAVAARLQAEGVKRGVPDVFIPIPVFHDHDQLIIRSCGLWIEFKKPGIEGHRDGGLKPDQVQWRQYLLNQNFDHFVAYSWLTARDKVISYLT